MGARAYKYFTIQDGGVPQPLVGSYLTASVLAPQVIENGLIQNNVTLTVADSSMFVGAQYANVIDVGTYAQERVRLISAPTATTIVVQGLKNAHAGGAYGTGAWVSVGDLVETVVVQSLDGNTAALYVGDSPQLVKATGVHVLTKIVEVTAGTQPTQQEFGANTPAFTMALSQFWIDGTTADSYLPSTITV